MPALSPEPVEGSKGLSEILRLRQAEPVLSQAEGLRMTTQYIVTLRCPGALRAIKALRARGTIPSRNSRPDFGQIASI